MWEPPGWWCSRGRSTADSDPDHTGEIASAFTAEGSDRPSCRWSTSLRPHAGGPNVKRRPRPNVNAGRGRKASLDRYATTVAKGPVTVQAGEAVDAGLIAQYPTSWYAES